ncbi:MAG: arylsulfatase [Bryobacterales bacterium]|nr:arylsulfatase [Bryobacterales bacterium]
MRRSWQCLSWRLAPPPNFLVIVADDMGYADLGSFGGEINTANLDALATGGLRFTQFYNTSRCWPTRASLLTGYYAQQVRRDSMPGFDMREFGNRGVRPAWARLISDRLREAGYFSYHSGKWHVDGAPLENGFLHSYQSHTRAGFFHLVGQDRDGEPLPDLEPAQGAHLTTETARHAVEFLREHAEERTGKPFFLYLAFHAPHFPLHAEQEDIDRYRDRYLVGWDQLRRERHGRQRHLGITDSPLSLLDEDVGPPYDFPEAIELLGPGEVNRPLPWRRLSEQQRAFQATKMAIHAAMIDRMDREIGRVLQEVRDMGAFEDTVIFFLSDNGASAEIMVRGDGHDPDAPPGSAGTYLCLGPGFSSAANTPFRLHKTWVHEGGISTPLIVHWPAGIRARGEIRSRVGHVIDIPPTLLELAGLTVPGDAGPPEMEGRSLVPAFDRDIASPHEALWFYHQGNRALRKGDWKIVHTVHSRADGWGSVAAEEDARPGEWQLYDLAADRSEGKDLARQHPGVVRELASIWESWRDRFGANAARPD